MSTPRVSIVVPSYNHAPFVEQALRSVLAQDWADLELVVVDDGSRDESRAIIRRVLAETGAVRTQFVEQENAGAHAAISRGIELASGDLLGILNSDDTYLPGRVAALAARLDPRRDALAFSSLALIDADGQPLPPRQDVAHWYLASLRQSVQCPSVGFALLCNNIAITSGNLLFSRSLYARLGGFRPFRFCHDWDFLLRATRWVEPIFDARVLGAYRLHERNTIDAANVAAIDQEYSTLVSEYLEACEAERPANALAPCRANFPVYFPYFARTHTRFNSKRIVDLVRDPALCAAAPLAGARLEAWRGEGVDVSGREDLGRFVRAPDDAPRVPALDAHFLARELALVRNGLHEKYDDFRPRGLHDLELLRDWALALPD